MNYNFKNGDIVLFCWRPGYARWRKGKIVSNNFAMCNLPDFFGEPEYYVSELDENDKVRDDKKSVAIPMDSKYLVKFEPGMEWCIGEPSSVTPDIHAPHVPDKEYESDFESNIEKKLDDIIRILNLMLLDGHTTTDPCPYIPQPLEPYYNPYNPYEPSRTVPYDPERWKIYCKHNDQTYETTTSNNTINFDFNKYDNMSCTNGDVNAKYCRSSVDLSNSPHSTMYGDEIIDQINISKKK